MEGFLNGEGVVGVDVDKEGFALRVRGDELELVADGVTELDLCEVERKLVVRAAAVDGERVSVTKAVSEASKGLSVVVVGVRVSSSPFPGVGVGPGSGVTLASKTLELVMSETSMALAVLSRVSEPAMVAEGVAPLFIWTTV